MNNFRWTCVSVLILGVFSCQQPSGPSTGEIPKVLGTTTNLGIPEKAMGDLPKTLIPKAASALSSSTRSTISFQYGTLKLYGMLIRINSMALGMNLAYGDAAATQNSVLKDDQPKDAVLTITPALVAKMMAMVPDELKNDVEKSPLPNNFSILLKNFYWSSSPAGNPHGFTDKIGFIVTNSSVVNNETFTNTTEITAEWNASTKAIKSKISTSFRSVSMNTDSMMTCGWDPVSKTSGLAMDMGNNMVFNLFAREDGSVTHGVYFTSNMSAQQSLSGYADDNGGALVLPFGDPEGFDADGNLVVGSPYLSKAQEVVDYSSMVNFLKP